MSRTLFTADLHLCHEGIIRLCARPFASVAEMNGSLTRIWNAVVGPDDRVFVLGDFAHRAADTAKLRALFDRLNGRKALIIGNHDDGVTQSLPWESVAQVAGVTVDGQRVWMSHYAHRSWPGKPRGTWQLFGHSHGRLPGTSQSCDVGVDCWGFAPVTVAQIRQRLLTLPPPEEDDLEFGSEMVP
ncbi:MAG: metallophosphoesterase [Xanthobacteraceae bacterium]|nr:metallophosphoesterase [Xanthobacteraceae bacterium]